MAKHLDIQEFINRVIFRILPDVNSAKSKGVTTPAVNNLNILHFINEDPTTVTNFLKGAFYQTIRLVGDGNTTIDNNSTIKTNTSSPKLLDANKIYTFTNVDEVWLEDGS